MISQYIDCPLLIAGSFLPSCWAWWVWTSFPETWTQSEEKREDRNEWNEHDKMAEEWQKNGRICIWEGRMLRDREVMWRLCGAQRGKVWSTWQLRLLRPSRPSNTKWTKSARPHSLCARPLHRSSPSSLRIWCWARNLGPTWTKLRHGWFPGSFLGHK